MFTLCSHEVGKLAFSLCAFNAVNGHTGFHVSFHGWELIRGYLSATHMDILADKSRA
jgi:hypothetical protein